jgi:hypothetical protein
MKNIGFAHRISLLISRTIVKNKDIESLKEIARKIGEDSEVSNVSKHVRYNTFELLGNYFLLISPKLYSYTYNYNDRRHECHEDSLCFYVKIEDDYFQLFFKRETGVLISIKQFNMKSYEKIHEIEFIKVEGDFIKITPISSSFGFTDEYKLSDCGIYNKLKSF